MYDQEVQAEVCPTQVAPLGSYTCRLEAVCAVVNGVPATVMNAIQARGQIGGIVRVDVQIPAGTASGEAVVQVNVGKW